MTKKIFLSLAVFVIIAGGISAQSEVEERAKNNISLSVGVIGAELSYERMFSRHLSVLADVSYTTMIFMDEFTASAKGRWYPFGGAFYLDLGFGYTYGKGVKGFMADFLLTVFTFGWYLTQKDFDNDEFKTGGFLIQPGLGWKIDIGEPDGFVLPVSLGVNIKLEKDVGLSDILPSLRVGLGYSF